jgi:hypothetical protein
MSKGREGKVAKNELWDSTMAKRKEKKIASFFS